MVELELAQLDCKYAPLRIDGVNGALLASLAAIGQQVPALVTGGASNGQGAVLIDGYRRRTALRQLKRDTIAVTRLDMDESEALVLRHRMAQGIRPSALEDGWLLRELVDCQGWTQRELGQRLQRSASWVNGRLGLVYDLPGQIQQLVRDGRVPAHAAARDLLAFARANKSACVRLSENLGAPRYTTREIEALCAHWKEATPAQRDAIETQPDLFCNVIASPALLEHDPEAAEMTRGLLQLARTTGRLSPLAFKRRAAGADFARVATVCGARDRFEAAWRALRPFLYPEEATRA